MRRELEMPAELSARQIQGEQRAGIQVVALASVAVPVRSGIAHAPEENASLRVEGSRSPGGAAAGLPAVVCPGLIAGFTRCRHGIEAPGTLAGLRVVGIEKPAPSRFPAADADDHLAGGGNRCRGDGEAGMPVSDRCPPAFAPTLETEADQNAAQ